MRGSYRRSTLLLLAFALLVGLCLLAGCASSIKVTRGVMLGTYEARYEGYYGKIIGKETLVLNIDGTYEQTFVPTHGKGWKHTGQWTLDNSRGGSEVVLSDHWSAVDGNDLRPQPKVYPNAFSSVMEKAGVICILIDDDAGHYYCKIK